MNQAEAHCTNIIRQRIEITKRTIIGQHLEKTGLAHELEVTNTLMGICCLLYGKYGKEPREVEIWHGKKPDKIQS
jgi:hypothetical protein